MKPLLQYFMILVAFLIISPNTVLAVTASSNPSYYLGWDEEYYSDNPLFNAVISFPNGSEVQVDSNYRFLMIDGILLSDATVIIQDGRALVPIRIVGEALGSEVNWNATTRQVNIHKEGIQIVMVIDSKDVIVNGKSTSIDIPASLINGLTYVPLRFVSENLGANVGYYNEAPFEFLPVVWIEASTNQTPLTEIQAIEIAKKAFMTALDVADKESLVGMEDSLKRFADQLECTGDFSRFWIISQSELPTILVDKYSGVVFSFRGMYIAFWIDNGFNLGNYLAG